MRSRYFSDCAEIIGRRLVLSLVSAGIVDCSFLRACRQSSYDVGRSALRVVSPFSPRVLITAIATCLVHSVDSD